MRADLGSGPERRVASHGGGGREARNAARRTPGSAAPWPQLAVLMLLAAACAPALAHGAASDPASAGASQAAAAAPAVPGDSKARLILGDWLTQGGEGIIRISLAANGTYEGRIVGAPKSHMYAAGVGPAAAARPAVSQAAAEPAAHKYPRDGLLILRRLRYHGDGKWSGGTIEDPRTGLNFGCNIELLSARRIKVHGYLGISLLGRSQVWTRYRGDSRPL